MGLDFKPRFQNPLQSRKVQQAVQRVMDNDLVQVGAPAVAGAAIGGTVGSLAGPVGAAVGAGVGGAGGTFVGVCAVLIKGFRF